MGEDKNDTLDLTLLPVGQKLRLRGGDVGRLIANDIDADECALIGVKDRLGIEAVISLIGDGHYLLGQDHEMDVIGILPDETTAP